jgi:predicted Na+-dependent transporter
MRWLPALAILLGVLTRFGDDQTWVIHPCLALIMLAAFLERQQMEKVDLRSFVLSLLALQVGTGSAAFLILGLWDTTLAATVLVLALTPTALSAAAVASGAHADTRVVTSVITANNVVAALSLPLAFALFGAGPQAAAAPLKPALLVGSTVVVPLLVARLLHRVYPASRGWAGGTAVRAVMRVLWAIILYVSASKVGDWYATLTYENYAQYALPALVAAIAFGFFALVGYSTQRHRRLEALICFSHKNSGLALLLVLETLPLQVAAAILCYSLVQNAYFALFLSRGAETHLVAADLPTARHDRKLREAAQRPPLRDTGGSEYLVRR